MTKPALSKLQGAIATLRKVPPNMSAPAFDVIACGSLHLDIMVYAPSFPRPDETTVGTRWAMQCGGKGGNQAVMAARAGARVAMIGKVGSDDFGVRLRSNLADAAVDSRAVLVDETVGSGMSTAIVRDDGDYGAVIVSGANLRIEPTVAEAAWRDLGGAGVLILQNEIPEQVNLSVARAARANGAIVIMNAAPARSMSPALRECIDVLVVNRVEAEMLSGEVVHDDQVALTVIAKLCIGTKSVIVTLGGDGLIVKGADSEAVKIAPKRVKVVSSHGAGDCFCGALAAKLAQGASLIQAAEFANAEAARHVSGQGEFEES
ncbi:ribokinase [Methylocapsa sp. S129]|uniref:ribokinase n=1 Tax=Methylocapsa sp. S129 TaxID=1641869 RepID=UPI001FEF95B5|nr:ribokinase [Methylocapsa sp. S129]